MIKNKKQLMTESLRRPVGQLERFSQNDSDRANQDHQNPLLIHKNEDNFQKSQNLSD